MPFIAMQTSSTIAANQYQSVGVDQSFNLQKFKQGLNIEVLRYDENDMEFEVHGISCAVSCVWCVADLNVRAPSYRGVCNY